MDQGSPVRMNRPKKTKEPTTLRTWRISTVANTGGMCREVVEAYTKSEARAKVKQKHGLDRLVVGTVVQEI